MSMNINIKGFILPDDKFKKMKRIWDDCESVNVGVPPEVSSFFDDEYPDENGIEVELSFKEWDDGDMQAGIEIKVEDIPEKVKIIRFYNSW